jgi:Tfp pilus assembly protein PilX
MKETAVPLKIIGNQRGMALISALLLLLVVALMSVGVSMDTSMDVRIAAYQRFKARSFGFAESGVMVATDILEDNIYDVGWDAATADIDYKNLSPDYVGTLKIKQGQGSFYMNKNVAEAVALKMDEDVNGSFDIKAEVTFQRLVMKVAEGGAIQIASGYAGLGKGASGGGTHLLYNVMASGSDSDRSQTDLALHFRHVIK